MIGVRFGPSSLHMEPSHFDQFGIRWWCYCQMSLLWASAYKAQHCFVFLLFFFFFLVTFIKKRMHKLLDTKAIYLEKDRKKNKINKKYSISYKRRISNHTCLAKESAKPQLCVSQSILIELIS